MAARTEAPRHVVVRKKGLAAGDQPPSNLHSPVPPAAKWLGLMGLIPFVTLAVAPLHMYDYAILGVLLFPLALGRPGVLALTAAGAALIWRAVFST